MQGRLAADPIPLLSGNIAPFEWAQYILSAASWLLFLATFLVSLDRYTPRHEWAVRFPVAFICAGAIATLR